MLNKTSIDIPVNQKKEAANKKHISNCSIAGNNRGYLRTRSKI
jgi:hypothetical protein